MIYHADNHGRSGGFSLIRDLLKVAVERAGCGGARKGRSGGRDGGSCWGRRKTERSLFLMKI